MTPTTINISDEGLRFLEANKPLVKGLSYEIVKSARETSTAEAVSDNAWTIEGVNYRGQIVPVNLSRKLLPAMNLSQMSAHAKKAMKKGEPYAANAQLVYAIAKRAMEQGNRDVQKFMREAIFNQLPNTLSVVRYAPEGRIDTIVHNPGLSNKYSTKVDFVASDELVRGSKRRNDYKALLGTDNPDEVADVFGWVTEKDTYSWRVNSKPSSVDERVVGLYAGSSRFCLDCGGDPRDAGASFGVRFSQKILRQKS